MSWRGRRGALAAMVGLLVVVGCGVSAITPAAAASPTGLTPSNVRELRPQFGLAQFETGSQVIPVLYDGMVIASCSLGLCAEKAGTIVWSNPSFAGYATVTIHDGVGYEAVGATVGAFDPETGSTLWMTRIPTYEVQTRVVVGDGMALVGDFEGNVVALNAATGQMKWSTAVTVGGELEDVVPIVDGSWVLESDEASDVVALDARTGAAVWTGTEDTFTPSSMGMEKGLVYLMGVGYQQGLPNVAVFPAGGCGSTTCPASSQIVVPSDIYNGVVDEFDVSGKYVVTGVAGNLIVLDSTTMKPIWTNQPAAGYSGDTSDAVLSGGLILVSEGGYVEAYRESGCGQAYCRPLWSWFASFDTVLAPPAVSGTTLDLLGGGALYQFGFGAGPFIAPGAPQQPSGSTFADTSRRSYYNLGFDNTVKAGNYPVIGFLAESTDGTYKRRIPITGGSSYPGQSVQLTVRAAIPVSFTVRAITVGGLGPPSLPTPVIVPDGSGGGTANAFSSGPTDTLTMNDSYATSAGAMLIAAVTSAPSSSADQVTSITGAGVQWTRAVSAATPGAGTIEIWYSNPTTTVKSNKVVTFRWAAPARNVAAAVWRVSGADHFSPLDSTASVSGTSDQPRTPRLSAQQPGELLFAAVRIAAPVTGYPTNPLWYGPGYLQTSPTTRYGQLLCTYPGAGPTSVVHFTTSASQPWIAAAITVKPAPLP